jgi:DNA-binding MarR family transcriptional regulator
MKPMSLTKISEQDVIKLPGSLFLSDMIWRDEYGQLIEYRYRAIPYHLVYLLHKYGPVIPHTYFVEAIQDFSAIEISKPNSDEMEKERLARAAAAELIEKAVSLGLVSTIRPQADKRYLLYVMTEEQMAKLYRIREREAQIYAVTDAQALDPRNPTAGQTMQNETWCKNIYTEQTIRYDDVYRKDKSMLDKLRYLLGTIVLIGLTSLLYLLPTLEAFATQAGGCK